MRRLLLFLLVSLAAPGASPALRELFTRPFLWGTSPARVTWSKTGHTLAFLWNSEGRRFLDLYAYHPATKQLVRLTNLESDRDELNRPVEEKDIHQKDYLLPPSGLSSFNISQDGRRVAFAFKGDLYIADTDQSSAPRRLTHTKQREGNPEFSPDGNLLASIRGGQLYVQNLATGQLWQVTDVESGSVAGFRWSPNGNHFAYVVSKPGGRNIPILNYSGQLPVANPAPRSIAGDDFSGDSYYLVSSDGSRPRIIEGLPKGEGGLPDWSPDSKQVLIPMEAADWKKKQILVVDALTAKARTVYEEADPRWSDTGFAAWSPDSKTIWFTGERDGWAHLYRVAATGGDPQQLTWGQWEIRRESFSYEPQLVNNWIYYVSTEGSPASRQTFRVKLDGTGKEKLSKTNGLDMGLISGDGKYMAWIRASDKEPLDLWVGQERVTSSARPEFSKTVWPAVEYVTYPSRGDKAPVSARLMLPPGYSAASTKQYPAICYIHGAGVATSVLHQWGSYVETRYAFNTYLANKGYVILEMDYRGSTGYGKEWRTGVYLHMGGQDLDDVLGGVDYLRSRGNIDMKRIGIWGVSYGGFMTDMALFLAPGTFQAGAAWSAVNDWENYNAPYTSQRLNTPQGNPEAYRRSSPIHFSQNLQDHLLIVHGIIDDNVLVQDAMQLTEKLIHEGKDFQHILYPEESHSFVRDETWIDSARRTSEWFDRYLQ